MFLFRVADHWRCSVREVKQRINAAELAELMVYWSIEPFGQIRQDINFAHLASLIYNVNRGKNQRPKKIEDMMIYKPAPESPKSRMEKHKAMAQFIHESVKARNAVEKSLGGK